VTDDVLTMEELRRRRAEILDLARKHEAHRIAVFGSVARGERPAQTTISIFWSTSSPVPLFLITLAWSKTLRNFYALRLTW
jgi:predicted nucleotidyltransferase